VCDHYSKIAFKSSPGLPRELKRLAWLSLDSAEGQEYWAAMELMGRYAAANHALIHQHVAAQISAHRCCSISKTITTSHGKNGT
jgi:tRNA-splicing ligase RtcB (3'-phosphate/5'-hydroxy nucleic acid ligase)